MIAEPAKPAVSFALWDVKVSVIIQFETKMFEAYKGKESLAILIYEYLSCIMI